MTLPASGAISLSQVNTELGLSSSATITMNDTAVRTLFGQASGTVDMNTGHGKSYRVSISTTFSSNAQDQTVNISSIGGYVAGKSDVSINIPGSGTFLIASSVSTIALTITGGTAGDTVTVNNNGRIFGHGGQGGSGGSGLIAAQAGGTAMSIGYPISFNNQASGYAGGGGGGGGYGGGTASAPYPIVRGAGGGGGFGGGIGGPVNGVGTPTAAPLGNSKTGGAGTVLASIPGSGGAGTAGNGSAAGGGSSAGGGGAGCGSGGGGGWQISGPGSAGTSPLGNGGAGGTFPGGAGSTAAGNAGAGGGGGGGSAGGPGKNGIPNIQGSGTGGSAGKFCNLNGNTLTQTGDTSRIKGAVS
jgi:hypothetical protein